MDEMEEFLSMLDVYIEAAQIEGKKKLHRKLVRIKEAHMALDAEDYELLCSYGEDEDEYKEYKYDK